MAAIPPAPVDETGYSAMAAALARQKAVHIADGFPDAQLRIDRLKRLDALLTDRQKAWCDAADEDFGGRPPLQTRMEIYGALLSIRHACKHVASWMKPESRSLPMMLRAVGAKAQIFYQPLGTIGVISPWNFPLVLSIGGIAGALAAGNRVMLKPSELTPRVSALLKKSLDAVFAQEEVATVLGGPDIGQAFTRLPFDHLLFTGGPSVARQVMAAAAANLVPVTLELGGKCPAIVGAEADWGLAVDRILWGKIQNAGQICLAPDYVLLPEGHEQAFVEAARAKVARWYPAIAENPDYCAIINARHAARLAGYLDEARRRGVRVEPLGAAPPGGVAVSGHRMAPTLVIQPPDDLAVMQDEIFGPILPVRTYRTIEEAVAFVNARPKPLALYYFGHDAAAIRLLKQRTVSGGMTVNDIAGHASTETLPLGGVGNSGMGSYHGQDGFRNFSHAKAVLTQGRISLGRLFNPPYTAGKSKMLDRVIGKKMT